VAKSFAGIGNAIGIGIGVFGNTSFCWPAKANDALTQPHF